MPRWYRHNAFFCFWTAGTVGVVVMCLNSAYADPPGWQLVWDDDFEQLDTDRWDVITSYQPTNNSRHAYLPGQVSVNDGHLILTSENEPAGGLPYRSGQVISKSSQRHGRWEVRAKLPTTQGMWPAIWLLPDVAQHPWPSGGEIDIMENRGNQPTLTSSAFHYGTNPPYKHSFVFGEQQTRVGGDLVDYSNRFHTYAVDWTDRYLRFYVDDVHYYTVYDEDVDGFLSSSTQPMELVLNTAVGGDFLPNPNESTVWPQTFEIDWVRVYQANPAPLPFVNGGFESNGGTLAGWSVFGNDLRNNPNVLAANEAVAEGNTSLKLFGTFGSGADYSGVTQGIMVVSGQEIEASLESLIRSADSIAGTSNTLAMRIEFYSEFGAKFDSDKMLHVEQIQIADGSTTVDVWQPHTLSAIAPPNAVEARLAIVFHQPGVDAGAVHVDAVKFGVVDTAVSIGDYNGDGIVNLADYTVWRDSFGATGAAAIADGNNNGTVDAADYEIWSQGFGQSVSSAATRLAAVPESPTGIYSIASATFAYVYRNLLK